MTSMISVFCSCKNHSMILHPMKSCHEIIVPNLGDSYVTLAAARYAHGAQAHHTRVTRRAGLQSVVLATERSSTMSHASIHQNSPHNSESIVHIVQALSVPSTLGSSSISTHHAIASAIACADLMPRPMRSSCAAPCSVTLHKAAPQWSQRLQAPAISCLPGASASVATATAARQHA